MKSKEEKWEKEKQLFYVVILDLFKKPKVFLRKCFNFCWILQDFFPLPVVERVGVLLPGVISKRQTPWDQGFLCLGNLTVTRLWRWILLSLFCKWRKGSSSWISNLFDVTQLKRDRLGSNTKSLWHESPYFSAVTKKWQCRNYKEDHLHLVWLRKPVSVLPIA